MALDKKAKQKKFLEAYAKGSSISASARYANVERVTIYDWKEKDEQFAKQFADAYEQGNDRIDDEILRRAVDGYEVPMVSMGKIVYGGDGNPLMETKYSDSLTMFLAKSRMPKYRDKQEIQHSGSIDVTSAKEDLLAKLQAMQGDKS